MITETRLGQKLQFFSLAILATVLGVVLGSAQSASGLGAVVPGSEASKVPVPPALEWCRAELRDGGVFVEWAGVTGYELDVVYEVRRNIVSDSSSHGYSGGLTAETSWSDLNAFDYADFSDPADELDVHYVVQPRTKDSFDTGSEEHLFQRSPVRGPRIKCELEVVDRGGPPTVASCDVSVVDGVAEVSWKTIDARPSSYIVRRSTDGGRAVWKARLSKFADGTSVRGVADREAVWSEDAVDGGEYYVQSVYDRYVLSDIVKCDGTASVAPAGPVPVASCDVTIKQLFGKKDLTVTWEDVDNVRGYVVRRSTDGGRGKWLTRTADSKATFDVRDDAFAWYQQSNVGYYVQAIHPGYKLSEPTKCSDSRDPSPAIGGPGLVDGKLPAVLCAVEVVYHTNGWVSERFTITKVHGANSYVLRRSNTKDNLEEGKRWWLDRVTALRYSKGYAANNGELHADAPPEEELGRYNYYVQAVAPGYKLGHMGKCRVTKTNL